MPQTFGITGLRVGRANLHEPVSYTADGKSILFRHGDSAIEIHAHGYQERLRSRIRYSAAYRSVGSNKMVRLVARYSDKA